MDNKVIVTLEDGMKKEVNVLDIFKLEKYPNKEYIVYTFSVAAENGGDDDYACISELIESDNNFEFKTIESEEEWSDIQTAIKELELSFEMDGD